MELFKLNIVFWDNVLFAVPKHPIPITDAEIVVPVPLLLVKFLTVFEAKDIGAFADCIPITWDAAPVEFNAIEFAIVPPTILLFAVQVTPVPVFALNP